MLYVMMNDFAKFKANLFTFDFNIIFYEENFLSKFVLRNVNFSKDVISLSYEKNLF